MQRNENMSDAVSWATLWDRITTARPWSEALDVTKMGVPSSQCAKLERNMRRFFGNYLQFALLLIAFTMYVHPKLLFSVMVEAVIAYFLDRIPCRLNVKLTLVAQSYLITLLSFKAFLLALWMGITVASCCFLHMTTYCDQADQATPPVDHSVPNVQHVETKASSEDQKEEHKE